MIPTLNVIEETVLKRLSLKKGRFVLSSNRVSNYYYDLKSAFCRNPSSVLDYFIARITCEFDMIISAELGGALIASCLASQFRKPLCILRKDGSYINAIYGKVLIIDDVKTTGATLLKLRTKVLASNGSIAQELVGIDRSQETEETEG